METKALEFAQQLTVLDIDAAAIVVMVLAALLSFQIIGFVGAAFAILMRGVINVAVPIILISLLLYLVAGF